MKLALCLEYPIALQGGVSVLVTVFLREFTGQGHQVILVSPDSPETIQESEWGKLGKHFRWDPTLTSPSTAKNLAQLLANESIDLAHFHLGGNFGWGNRFLGYCPIVYLSRLGIPCFSTVHLVVNILDGHVGPQKPFLFKLGMLPFAWVAKAQQLRHVQTEVAVSVHDLTKLQRWYRPFRGRFAQIYHSRLSRAEPGPGNEAREKMILNVGHLAWRKGQATLAEAFAKIAPRHKDWTLQLAGPDSGDGAVDRIREITEQHQLGGRILLLGQRKDAQALMRRAAIYVQPSTAEALGLALQEAMFHGCACIGARAGGIPELVRDGETGKLVEAGNAGKLAEALEALINDATQRRIWGQSGADFIRKNGMTAEAMIERHLELYGTIAKR